MFYDSKLFGIMDRSELNEYILQRYIDNLVRWCSNWSLEFNFKKCCVMHYGAKNPNFEYSDNKDGTDTHILKAKIERFRSFYK